MIWIAIWEWDGDVGICGAYTTSQDAIDDIQQHFFEQEEEVEYIEEYDEITTIVYTNVATYRIELHSIK